MPNLRKPDYPVGRRFPRRKAGAVITALPARGRVRARLAVKAEPTRASPLPRFSVGTPTLVLLVAAMLAGCASSGFQPGQVHDADAGLYAWVDEELAPYLIDQLGRQPRFKNEPVLLVAMNGADVRPDIDALTRNVRARLTDRLLLTPGVNLYWRPSVQPWEHHRGKDPLTCDTASSARYFVGIDIASGPGDGYRVSVRALDVGTATWVTGFGKTWRGRLTSSQQQALADRRPDEYLRGLRVLPFYAGETDLLAAYLAQNSSCLLRAQGAADYRVFVDTGTEKEPNLQKVLALVAHNLARHQTVQITDRAEDAELILSGSSSEIDASLHQVWVKVRAKTSATHLTSVDTGAYIHLDRSAASRVAAGPIVPRPARRSPSVRAAVLSKLRVLTARDPDDCADGAFETLAPQSAVEPGSCFLIEFDLYAPAHVLVLNHTVDGMLMRLPQDGCPPEREFLEPQLPRRHVRIVKGAGTDFRWAGQPGIESVYAVAVTDNDLARAVSRHVAALPDGCAVHAGDSASVGNYRTWLAQLDRLIERGGDQIDWQAVRVRHTEP